METTSDTAHRQLLNLILRSCMLKAEFSPTLIQNRDVLMAVIFRMSYNTVLWMHNSVIGLHSSIITYDFYAGIQLISVVFHHLTKQFRVVFVSSYIFLFFFFGCSHMVPLKLSLSLICPLRQLLIKTTNGVVSSLRVKFAILTVYKNVSCAMPKSTLCGGSSL